MVMNFRGLPDFPSQTGSSLSHTTSQRFTKMISARQYGPMNLIRQHQGQKVMANPLWCLTSLPRTGAVCVMVTSECFPLYLQVGPLKL